MKTRLFAGLLFAVAAFAQTADPGADARFRAKYGRSIRAEEQTKPPAAKPEMCSCCKRMR